MKKFLPTLFIVAALLPQACFAITQPVNPQMAAFIKQQDAEGVAFFQQQAVERAAFFQDHKDIIAKLDEQGKAALAQKWAQNHPGAVVPPTYNGPKPDAQGNYAAFMQKQASDKEAFLSKLAAEKQAFLATQGPQ